LLPERIRGAALILKERKRKNLLNTFSSVQEFFINGGGGMYFTCGTKSLSTVQLRNS